MAARWLGASVGLLLTVGAARAAEAQPPPPAHQPGTPRQAGEWVQTFEAQAQIGVQFFPGAAAHLAGSGLAYGVSIGWKPLWLGGIELSYQGANYSTSVEDLAPSVSIFENGVQLLLRISPRFGVFEPYALAGGAISFVNVRDNEGVKHSIQDDMLVKVPLGLGVDIHLQPRNADPTETHVIVGARASYLLVFFNDFLPVTSRGADQMSTLVLLGVGF
ncbi:hypothetical protein [Vulgatibacter incomptus]|uniref:Outer membrane protein beta-barrel domain-containing protein n=1 Tax=Vulgatibacter incomptus TaxID=1391653 RepID=A0A0K1P863_9BACT|nr:hypothetical protein [Vulgatibacter incomptus]AKU89708.1 hypothetical protein AKJ08_0095 [Vulgatibacter incomptus]